MIKLTVDDPMFVNAALFTLVKLIDTEEGIDRLLSEGCPADLLDNIRQRKARDLLEAAPWVRTLHISISVSEVGGALNRIDRERQDQELFEYFVKHGASRGMICELWKKTNEEVTSMRKQLLPDGGGNPGRAPLPKDPAVREAIHNAWHEIVRDPHAAKRERIYQLHQLFPHYAIDSLVSTVTEFNTPERPRARRAGQKSLPIDLSQRVRSSPFNLP